MKEQFVNYMLVITAVTAAAAAALLYEAQAAPVVVVVVGGTRLSMKREILQSVQQQCKILLYTAILLYIYVKERVNREGCGTGLDCCVIIVYISTAVLLY